MIKKFSKKWFYLIGLNIVSNVRVIKKKNVGNMIGYLGVKRWYSDGEKGYNYIFWGFIL